MPDGISMRRLGIDSVPYPRGIPSVKPQTGLPYGSRPDSMITKPLSFVSGASETGSSGSPRKDSNGRKDFSIDGLPATAVNPGMNPRNEAIPSRRWKIGKNSLPIYPQLGMPAIA